MDGWFDDWDVQSLYQDDVKGSNKCAKTSPIAESGIVCGPVLKLWKVDYTDFLYQGSILVITKNTDETPNIRYKLGPSYSKQDSELHLQDGEFSPHLFHSDQLDDDTFRFFRFHIELPLGDVEQMVKYSLNGRSELHYRFYIPSKTMNFNSVAYSCNGFSLSTDTTKFQGSLWFDILKKHSRIHYHVMLGGGDQIYSDSIKLHCNAVDKWLQTKDLVKRYSTKVDAKIKRDIDQFYLREYIEWYGYGHWQGSTPESMTTQKCLPKALACIPSVNFWDDHDIIDGFGSYSDAFMKTEMFSNIGRSAYMYYMLFQQQVSIKEKAQYLENPSWILGAAAGPYIGELSHSVYTNLGPNVALLGLDCRTERQLKQILSNETYDIVFKRLTREIEASKNKIEHLYVMLGVPISYPRLVWLETLFSSRALAPLKYLAKKGYVNNSLVNEFNGDIELLDDLNDHWCAHHHKKERNKLMARLQDFGAKYGVRITILSGDVHLASVGRFRTKLHSHHFFGSNRGQKVENEQMVHKPQEDTRLMFNVISSAVVNTPPPDGLVKLLQRRSGVHYFDFKTFEDAMPIFQYEVDGTRRRPQNSFMNKRNWSDMIPMENVMNNEYLQRVLQVKLNDKIIPGIVSATGGMNRTSHSSDDLPYPATAKSIIASINIEQNSLDIGSHTAKYAFPIPELTKTSDSLSHRGIKHLDLS